MTVIDIKFPEVMTAQEVFDTSASWLLKQGKKSEDRFCLYRGPDNTACAVGCLIQDDEYKPSMDDRINGDTSLSHIYELGLLPKRLHPHIELLSDLQDVHDTVDVDLWPDVLLYVAKNYRLNTSVLDKNEIT